MRRIKKFVVLFMVMFSLSLSSFTAYAGVNGESDSSNGFVGADGNWEDAFQGLRFTLVTSEGNIVDSVDVYSSTHFGNLSNYANTTGSPAQFAYDCMTKQWNCGESEIEYAFVFNQCKLETAQYWNNPESFYVGKGDYNGTYIQYNEQFWRDNTLVMDNIPPVTLGNFNGKVATPDVVCGYTFIELFKESFFKNENIVNQWGKIFTALNVPGNSYEERIFNFAAYDYTILIEPVYWVQFNYNDIEKGAKVYGTATEIILFGIYLTNVLGNTNLGDYFNVVSYYTSAMSMHLTEDYDNAIYDGPDYNLFREYDGTMLNSQGAPINWQYVVQNMAVIIYNKDDFSPISVDAKNYEYRTNTDVVTSFRVANNEEDEDFAPTVEEIIEAEIYNRDPVALKAEIIFSTDPDHNNIITDPSYPTELTIQGIAYDKNTYAEDGSTYMYFKWRTPDTPQTLYITYRFMFPDGSPIVVNPMNNGGILPKKAEVEKDGVTTIYHEFTSEVTISDTIDKMTETSVNDTLGGFIGGLSENASQEYKDAYNKSAEAYRNYDKNAVSPIDSYLPVDESNNLCEVTNIKWTEYTAEISADGTKVDLIPHQYRADSWLETAENTEAWINGPKNPLVVMDYTPQKIKNLFSKLMNGIPAGYGFSFSYQETYNGSNDIGSDGYSITAEELEVVRDACTMFQNGMILFPEYNYSLEHAGVIETVMEFDKDTDTFDCAHALEINGNSLHTKVDINNLATRDDLKSRVHFIPVWFPENTEYTIEVLMFDFWTPVGQIYDRETYTLYVDGTIYDNWYVTKSDVNQKR